MRVNESNVYKCRINDNMKPFCKGMMNRITLNTNSLNEISLSASRNVCAALTAQQLLENKIRVWLNLDTYNEVPDFGQLKSTSWLLLFFVLTPSNSCF